jgi:hypothetical protein
MPLDPMGQVNKSVKFRSKPQVKDKLKVKAVKEYQLKRETGGTRGVSTVPLVVH